MLVISAPIVLVCEAVRFLSTKEEVDVLLLTA
jgi:hypothetical protein